MLEASLQKNDIKARWIIFTFSVVIFAAVVLLGRFKLNVDLGFNVHIFAKLNALINSLVAILLVAALVAVKMRKYNTHKTIMLFALSRSVIFLVSYVAHRLLSGEAYFGDTNHDGVLSPEEKVAAGSMRIVYLLILATHIFLAAIILPLILFTAYRGLTAEFPTHKKLARYTWPLWFYVAVTGPVVYWMISPYYR
ncbi:MAG: DUF420 domain-containing protein [Bacteroidota bacterium]